MTSAMAFWAVLLGILCTLCACEPKTVKIGVQASWASAPIALEASEFFAEADANLFWEYIEVLNALKNPADESAALESAQEMSKAKMSTLQSQLLSFAISVRQFSPRVEMMRQLALMDVPESSKSTDMKSFAVLDDVAYTLPRQIETAVSAWRPGKTTTYIQTDADHLYRTNVAEDVPTVILYANIVAPEFQDFHSQLKLLADSRKIRYVLRHFVQQTTDQKPVEMNGFGVEMAIKNMEYKAVDDREVKDGNKEEGGDSATEKIDDTDIQGFQFGKLIKRHAAVAEKLKVLRQELLNDDVTDKPLKVWELKNLGVQVLQRILAAPDPLRTLQDISHNLPSMAHSLVRMPVNTTLAKSLEEAEQLTMQFGRTTFVSMNKQPIEIGHVDPFSLYEVVRREIETLDGIASLHLPSAAVQMIRDKAQARQVSVRLDGRAPTVHYMNDLEEDKDYLRWPKTVQALLQPNWPGQLYFIRKNLFTVIFVFDPSKDDGLRVAAMAEQILSNQMPVRIGIALIIDPSTATQAESAAQEHDYNLDDLELGDHFQCAVPSSSKSEQKAPKSLAETVIRLYRYIRRKYENRAALRFLASLYMKRPILDQSTQSRKDLTLGSALKIFQDFLKSMDGTSAAKSEEIFKEEQQHKRYNSAIDNARRYVKDKGFRKFPVMLLNGMSFVGNTIDRSLMSGLHMEQQRLQRLVHEDKIDDSTSIHDYVLDEAGAFERYHPDTITEEPHVVPIVSSPQLPASDANVGSLSTKQLSTLMLNKLSYLRGKNSSADGTTPVTMWVVADLASEAGVRFASEAMTFIKTAPSQLRLAFIFNHNSTSPPGYLPKVRVASKLAALSTSAVHDFLHVVFDVSKRNLTVSPSALNHLANKFLSSTEAKLVETAAQDVQASDDLFQLHRSFCDSVLKVAPPQNALVTNGRVVFLEEQFPLSALDLNLLYQTELKSRAKDIYNAVHPHISSIHKAFKNAASGKSRSASDIESDIIMQASSTLLAPVEEKQDAAMRSAYMPPIFDKAASLFQELTVRHENPDAQFEIVAALNPLDKDAQRLAPVLAFLQDLFPVSVKLILYPPTQIGELPYTTFYRYVLPSVSKGTSGILENKSPRAFFEKLPQKQLLTMHLDTPEAWLMEPLASGQDLDNIKLSAISHTSIFAKFRIAKLYVQGNCDEKRSSQPPRGLQLELRAAEESVSDTLVMANLGYFQLKATPGAFQLHIVSGRSSDLYEMQGGKGLKQGENGAFSMNVDSFTGRHVTLTAKKKPGKEDQELLEVPEGTQLDLWGQIQSRLWGGSQKKVSTKKTDDETINIFSLASGHLYERFMRIMILSVVKNTKSKVKFWMLKNFLSSKFTDLLPKMARQYNFDFELVTYQWPKWLHAQTEKQRIIWGYKILFLDVLFPLDVKKVIYIDADQVVKADIKELWDMPLDGAPLAMVPMGDSRKETEGFRFWKQGFWKSHLAGKPYHISALFVADLQMFRAVAAGDQLRIVYEQLSKDKNSLANLDQDLPNYTQHQIPIFSLPKNWLYCATWCSDADLKTAKTVDLCNNPLTKTPKLEMAKKIVPEWVALDEEVGKLEEELDEETGA
jgi:UDP-glucose:glycoprotein glucosyltransferase